MDFNTKHCRPARSWVLPQGQAQTFVAHRAGVLRVASGRAWVTLSHSRQRAASAVRPALAEDDLFLDAAASLPLRAGQAVVLESWSAGPAADLALVWEAAAYGHGSQRWQETVAQPARELAQGLMQAGHALAAMVQGLLGYTLLRVARPFHLR